MLGGGCDNLVMGLLRILSLYSSIVPLLGRAQSVIPPNLYNVNEHNSVGSPGNSS